MVRKISAGTVLAAGLVAVALPLSAACGAGGGNGSTAQALHGPVRAAAGPQTAGGAGVDTAPAKPQAAPASPQDARSLIITAGLQVRTGDVAGAARRAERLAAAVGGYLSGESIGSGSQSLPADSSPQPAQPQPDPVRLPDLVGAAGATQALLVLRVPPAQVDAVLGELGGGGEVTYRTRTATDVTTEVADVASRVGSAQASIAELRTLIDRAASMGDLVSLEQALSQRESDLESLEAQQKALTDQVQLATITVGYYARGEVAGPPPVRTGFGRGLASGWHGFIWVLRAFLVLLGWLTPFAALAVVLGWPALRLRRILPRRGSGRGRPSAATPAPDTAPPSQ